jgi:hypothetical protein
LATADIQTIKQIAKEWCESGYACIDVLDYIEQSDVHCYELLLKYYDLCKKIRNEEMAIFMFLLRLREQKKNIECVNA